MSEAKQLFNRLFLFAMGIIALGAIVIFFFASCTISFQNIDTHGPATDLIDETQTNTPDIKPDITIPV